MIEQVKFVTMHKTSLSSTYVIRRHNAYAYFTGMAEGPKNRLGHYGNILEKIVGGTMGIVLEKM